MAKAKTKIAKEEFDNFEEEDYDYSDEPKSTEKNIFGKAYSFLEEKYFAFSDWLSKKGVPLDKLNNFLEEKGIPAFAFVTCFFILLLALMILLIINIATTASIKLDISDYSGSKLSDVQLIITDLSGRTKFSGVVSDGQIIKAKLKSGVGYNIDATKVGFDYPTKEIAFERGQPLRIKFNEKLSYGDLSLIVVDSQTKKIIPLYEVKLAYRENGVAKEEIGIADEKGEITFTGIPLEKEITMTINADGYQNLSQNFTLSNSFETKTMELAFDESSLSLSGKEAKLTIVVTKENGDLLDAANVTIYDLAGEIIATDITKLGKALFTANVGQAIRFVVTKEGYRTYDSDKEARTFRIQNSEETFTAKLTAGSSDLKVLVTERGLGPLVDAEVSLYNENNNLIESKTTQLDGAIIFTGLEKNKDYVVTVCKPGYYCLQAIANIEETNQVEASLEKISLESSVLLSVYVYDTLNNPITNAKVTILKEVMGKFIASGHGTLSVDLMGQTTITGKSGDKYKVTAIVGETEKTEEIVLDPFKDNKLIMVLDHASRLLTLNLTDKDGNPIIDGCVLITSKTGEILFDDCLYGSNIIEFNNQGYKDLIIEYIDPEGNITTTSTRVGTSDQIDLKIKPSAVGNTPVISFVELRDNYNSPTTLLSINGDYYAVFDVSIPEGSTSCGVHFRAGEDSKSDADNMTYGITGYKADTTNYKYSTTYNPGQQVIDYDNYGEPNRINKWLELYWNNASGISNKQVMLKLKATDINEKFVLRYRTWCESLGKVYRDPVDSILGEVRTNSQRQFLYAETKEKIFDILEKPTDCSGDLCVDYKFIDQDTFDYSPEKFYAVKDGLYALEFTFLSSKNTEITIDTQTENARPIIGLVNYQDVGNFPSNQVTSEEIQISYSNLNLEAARKKQVYLFFVAKETGVTYLDIKINNDSKITEKRISFNVVPRRELEVIVPEIIAYNAPITIDIKDKATKQIIDNAFVKVNDEFGSLLGSVKNSRTGKYIINQNFTSSKPVLEVTAPGYTPYFKELTIADTGIIQAPDKLEIRFGENISQEIETFSIVNRGKQDILDLRYEMKYIDYIASMQASTDLPFVLKPGVNEKIELLTTVDPKVNFKTAKGNLVIYGFVGNRQVVKEIEVIYYRGTVKNDCLEIKPKQLFAYVGISQDSMQDLEFTIKNNCQKPISITPQLLNAKGTTIRKDENIEVMIPTIDIDVGEEVSDYIITVKNNKERKLTKTYNFEIAWRNQYFVFDNTKLTVELIDLSKSIIVIPASSAISLVQTVDQQPALNQTAFIIKNTGKHPVTDIQISRFEPTKYGNIEDKIEPPTFDVIKPGEGKSVVIRYSGKIDKATYADLLYKVTANAKGVSTPITSNFTVAFLFSSSGCLKLDQTRISFYSKVNEEKTKLINITNQCAEPVGLITHDQGNRTFFTDTFGDGTQVTIFPATPAPMIYPGQTVGYYFKVKPTKYFPPKTDKVLRFLGTPANFGQGGIVSSSSLLFSIELEPETPEQKEDSKRVEQNLAIPICGEDPENEESTMDLAQPIIVPDCKQDGYCDATAAAEFILEKIQQMHTEIITVANQANNKVYQTGCSQTAANNGYCPIEDILPPQKMQEYKNILLYLQNDSVTERTVELLLKDQNSPKYPTIKNHMVRANVGHTTGGLASSGNIIHISNKLKGCGRYKLEINGSIATKNFTELDTERSYFFLDVVDVNTTEQCKKSIENVMIYLPKDLKFIRTNTGDTWLTIISGNKDFAQSVAKDVYGSEDRFVLRSAEQKKYSILDVSVGKIEGNESESSAIAKMFFKDLSESKTPKPEEISIIINSDYGIVREGQKDVNYSEEFKTETARNIKAILESKPANVCIAKDKSYLLIMSIDKDFGALFLKSKADGKLQLKPTKTCTEFTVKSAVNEQVAITYEPLAGTQITFDVNGQGEQERLSLILEKDKETDFNVCIKSDISQISSWNNKEIKIIAESKFSEVGKINSKRKGESLLKITSYGITPIEFFALIQKTAEELTDEKTTDIIYAYVDWDKNYNPINTEEYCKALEKYNKKIEDKETFFRKPAECKFAETKSEKNAKINRGAQKAGTYMAACFGSCAAYQAGADFLWQFVPIAGQIKYGADVAWNCGLGCSIPAITLYLEESEVLDGLKKAIDEITDKIPIVSGIKAIGEKIFSFFSGDTENKPGSTDLELVGAGITAAGINAAVRTAPASLVNVSGIGVPEIGYRDIPRPVTPTPTSTTPTQGVGAPVLTPISGTGGVASNPVVVNVTVNAQGGTGGSASSMGGAGGSAVATGGEAIGGTGTGGSSSNVVGGSSINVSSGTSSNAGISSTNVAGSSSTVAGGTSGSAGGFGSQTIAGTMPNSYGSPTISGMAPTNVAPNVFSNNIQRNLSTQMGNRLEYINRALPNSHRFLSNTGNNSSGILLNSQRLSTSEILRLENISRKMTTNGRFSWDDFVKLSDSELDDFATLINKAGYKGIGSGGMAAKDVALRSKIAAVEQHRSLGGVFRVSNGTYPPPINPNGPVRLRQVNTISNADDVASGIYNVTNSGSTTIAGTTPNSFGTSTTAGTTPNSFGSSTVSGVSDDVVNRVNVTTGDVITSSSGGSATGGTGIGGSSSSTGGAGGSSSASGGTGGNVQVSTNTSGGSGPGGSPGTTGAVDDAAGAAASGAVDDAAGAAAGVADDAAGVVDDVADDLIRQNTITYEILQEQLKTTGKAVSKLTKNKAALQSQIEGLSKNRGIFGLSKKAKIAKLQKQLGEVDEALELVTKRNEILKSVGSGELKDGVYYVDDLSSRILNNNLDDMIRRLPGSTSKWTKFLRTGSKIGVDMVVIYLSNKTANSVVEWATDEGKLSEGIYIDGTLPISEFKKGTWYRVQVYKTENKSLSMIYTIEEPNITTENKIFYKNNNDVLKLITTENTEELYQTNSPMTSELYTPDKEGGTDVESEEYKQMKEYVDSMYSTQDGVVDTTKIVTHAEQYIGNKYVWGGTNPNTGADCSGFVQYLYNKEGISLPRTARPQSKCGTTVGGLESAVPGDLIFYSKNGTQNGVYHVTIYAGDGEMVHASNSSPYPKGGIKKSNVYDQSHIYAIKRVSGIKSC